MQFNLTQFKKTCNDTPSATKIHGSNRTIHFGDWNNYYYCEPVANSLASYTHDHQFSRLEIIDSIDEIKSGETWLKTGNFLLIEGDAKTCYHIVKDAEGNLKQRLHADAGEETVDGETVLKEDKQIVYLPFNQLFTGYGWGVKHIPITDYPEEQIKILDNEKSADKFNPVVNNGDIFFAGTTVSIGELFAERDDIPTLLPIKGENVMVFVSPETDKDTVRGTYTANADDWTKGKLSFSGTGNAVITITDYFYCKTATVTVNVTNEVYIATIRSSGNYWYMTSDLGTASTKRYQAVDSGLTQLPIVITDAAEGYVFILEAQEDGTYKIRVKDTDNYLGWTSGNSGALVAEDDALTLIMEAGETEGTWVFHFAASDAERYLALNGTCGNNYFAWYKSGQKQNLTLIPVQKCEHENTTTVSKEATCTEEGYIGRVICAACGEVLEAGETITATGHKYETKVTAPTCTEAGYTVHTCACGDSYTDNEVEATGHNYVDGTCSACGKDEETTVIINTTYTFSDYAAGTQYAENEVHVLDNNVTITTTDAHFTSELRLYSSSTNNGYAVIESTHPIKTIGVNAGNKVDVLVVYGSEDGATWTEIARIEVTSTSYKDYSVELEKTYNWIKLDVAGSNQVRLKSITLGTVATTGGETPEQPTCRHTNTTTTTVDATCTAAGSVTVTCDDCGETVSTETIEALGHSYDEGEVTTAAGCETTGVLTKTCSACGDKKTESIEATGHTTDNGVCDNCGETISGSTEPTTFEFGANGSASHADGSSKTSYSETVNGYTLNITGGTNMYTGARDAKGNSCIKLGMSSKTGGFSFTVANDVTKVIIYIAKYKTNTTKITVNGTPYTLTLSSNDGEYDAIEIDTSSNKTVTLTTVSGGVRAMVNTIEFYA